MSPGGTAHKWEAPRSAACSVSAGCRWRESRSTSRIRNNITEKIDSEKEFTAFLKKHPFEYQGDQGVPSLRDSGRFLIYRGLPPPATGYFVPSKLNFPIASQGSRTSALLRIWRAGRCLTRCIAVECVPTVSGICDRCATHSLQPLPRFSAVAGVLHTWITWSAAAPGCAEIQAIQILVRGTDTRVHLTILLQIVKALTHGRAAQALLPGVLGCAS